MDFLKLEHTFTDFIINLVGPSHERDLDRQQKYKTVKTLLNNTFKTSEYIYHIFTYGSFPIKSYLKDADIDITILFENKTTHLLETSLPFDHINSILTQIKQSFEEYNLIHKQETFKEINIILAEIPLVKCKIDNISIDISINNLTGISKIVFMSYIEKHINTRINNSFLFQRTLLLIKSWAYYEGNIIGSNIGLMAGYALEILVIYLFNNYSHLFTSEISAFFTFFHVLNEMDWEKEIIHIFGTIKQEHFTESLTFISEMENFEIDPFWYLDYENIKDYPYALDFLKTQGYIKKIEKIILGNEKGSTYFCMKNMNILDPILSNNNLGKSINPHSSARIKKIFTMMNKEIDNIVQIRNKNDPFLYVNALLMLYRRILKNNYVDIFAKYLDRPNFVINVNEGDSSSNNNNQFKCKCEFSESDINEFNSLFDGQNCGGDNNNNKSCNVDYTKYDIIMNKDIYNQMVSQIKILNKQNKFISMANFVLEGNNFNEVEQFFHKFGYL